MNDKTTQMMARLKKVANLHRIRRLCHGHYYVTQDNMHVTFTQRPTEATMEAIKKMVKVAMEHIDKIKVVDARTKEYESLEKTYTTQYELIKKNR